MNKENTLKKVRDRLLQEMRAALKVKDLRRIRTLARRLSRVQKHGRKRRRM